MRFTNLENNFLRRKKTILVIFIILIFASFISWLIYEKYETKRCVQQMIEENQGKDIIGNISSIYKYCEITN